MRLGEWSLGVESGNEARGVESGSAENEVLINISMYTYTIHSCQQPR